MLLFLITRLRTTWFHSDFNYFLATSVNISGNRPRKKFKRNNSEFIVFILVKNIPDSKTKDKLSLDKFMQLWAKKIYILIVLF